MYAKVVLLALAASASAFQAEVGQRAVAAVAARATAPPVAGALVPRADAAACATSANAISKQGLPTPTDKALSSFIDAQTDSTFSVPSSLQKQFCTYEANAIAWYSSVYIPFQKDCSKYIPDSLEINTASLTTESWCAAATKNVAGPRETKGAMAVLAACGMAAAML